MNRKRVVVVRTGTANIGSVMFGLERAGADPAIAFNPQEIVDAEYVMVPGVGSFGSALEQIKGTVWESNIKLRVERDKPTMFICVGLQIMGHESEESPGAVGLDVFPGKVTRFDQSLVVPQQAWNFVVSRPGARFVDSGHAYFSNSYKLDGFPEGWTGAEARYGSTFVASVERGSVLATQFHPELSGKFGLDILRRWLGVLPPLSDEGKVTQFPEDSRKIPRIVPCLDIKGGQVVKGIKFQNVVSAGDPSERSAAYEAQGADEIVVLDISATEEERKTTTETVRAIRMQLSVPLCVGGGIKTVADAERILEAGADKVAVNTAAVRTPEIIDQMAARFGRQCTVLSLDAALRTQTPAEGETQWEVVIAAGKQRTGIDAVAFARSCVARGAGEILLTSWDRDGTRSGYDLQLISAITRAVSVPVIASGGGSSAEDMAQAIASGADAVLAASIFHYGDTTVGQIKRQLQEAKVPVRL